MGPSTVDSFETTKLMDKATFFIQMGIGTRDSGRKIRLLDWELTSESKEESTMDIGKTMNQMAMELRNGPTKTSIKVTIKTDRNMEKGLFTGLRVHLTRANGRRGKYKGKVNTSIRMGGRILETG
jgi:hypothetical protein